MSTEDVRIRAAMASARLPGLADRALRVLINGVWLGALSEERLRALDEHYYAGEDAYRKASYNERGLFHWERPLIEAHFAPGARVVVIGCGGGREVLALLEDGYEALGFDPHAELVAWARDFLAAHGHPDRARTMERDELPAGVECDAILVGWGAYGLMHGRERRIAFLRAARERLAHGAPLMLSCFERPAHGRELRWTARLANLLRELRGRPRLEAGDTLAPTRVHVFTRAELESELSAAGFTPRAFAIVGRDNDTNHAAVVAQAA